MSLYTDRFSTDWDTLGREEAVERSFALGVAASLGEHHREEFEAVSETMETNYDTSLVELAYEEGKRKATKREREADPDADDRDIWEAVIREELDDAPPDEEDANRPTDLPSVVSDVEVTEFPDREPEQTDFPDFLE